VLDGQECDSLLGGVIYCDVSDSVGVYCVGGEAANHRRGLKRALDTVPSEYHPADD
jgi:hypothetical protein